MARPMILIKPNKLKELHLLAAQGVPVSYLVRTHNLEVTSPTLAKLLAYYNLYLSAKTEATAQHIWDSLFPDWLINSPFDCATQDSSSYTYKGRMPIGQWFRVDPDLKTEEKSDTHSPYNTK